MLNMKRCCLLSNFLRTWFPTHMIYILIFNIYKMVYNLRNLRINTQRRNIICNYHCCKIPLEWKMYHYISSLYIVSFSVSVVSHTKNCEKKFLLSHFCPFEGPKPKLNFDKRLFLDCAKTHTFHCLIKMVHVHFEKAQLFRI